MCMYSDHRNTDQEAEHQSIISSSKNELFQGPANLVKQSFKSF